MRAEMNKLWKIIINNYDDFLRYNYCSKLFVPSKISKPNNLEVYNK